MVTDVNPAGTVPFIVVDGKMMNESAAVMKYLCMRFGAQMPTVDALYPSGDLEKRYQIDRALDFNGSEFRPAFMGNIFLKFGSRGRDFNEFEQTRWDMGVEKCN